MLPDDPVDITAVSPTGQRVAIANRPLVQPVRPVISRLDAMVTFPILSSAWCDAGVISTPVQVPP